MITVLFLCEWAVRSAVLILGGALLLKALGVADAATRLASWAAILGGSLLIPAMPEALPGVPLVVLRAVDTVPVTPLIGDATISVPPARTAIPGTFDWPRAGLLAYSLGAGILLLRLMVGLAMSARLRRASIPTGQVKDGIEIRESARLISPVALGIARPVILLPADWRQWDQAKLDAVLAHERSHIRRWDPALQFLSAMHRALLWFSPLSWWLHGNIVRAAEEASDDAAVASIGDRDSYAKILLEFMQRRGLRARQAGVPMARYGRPDDRIQRILDGVNVEGGVSRGSLAAIFALGLPLLYFAGTARPMRGAAIAPLAPAAELETPQTPQNPPGADSAFLRGLGSVEAYTVTIRPRVDGQLMSVNFKEGDMVQTGQVLAVIDPRPYQLELQQAEGELAGRQANLTDALVAVKDAPKNERMAKMGHAMELQGDVKIAQGKVDEALLRVKYTQMESPITGVAGLRMVDPGNMIHAADAAGIVVINQLRPISVVFALSENQLPRVRRSMQDGGNPTVEAWNRDMTAKIATGRLAAIDNQIDPATGTVKLKADFDNKDGALFPKLFVNVRLYLNGAR